MEEKIDNQNPHSEHRARLTDFIYSAGMEKICDVQVVEYFLTTIIPSGDVNPIAHELLNKYGSFHSIVDANTLDLMDVEGISETSAKRIKLFGQLMERYVTSKLDKKLNLKNIGEFLDYLEELVKFSTIEKFHFFALNSRMVLTGMRSLDMDSVRKYGITPDYVFKFLASTRAKYVVVAHSHSGGTARASETDIQGSARIEKLVTDLECKFFDSFVVGEDGIFSCKQKDFVRTFDDA